jgi:hypothetical protein
MESKPDPNATLIHAASLANFKRNLAVNPVIVALSGVTQVHC